ncbi:DUF1345 domain-containing protein [Pararhizobium gei]|uniref:DUF1345 domain-containing protein n=1 Tax=Pararhizobium gei TaxID=1395951 RepID=UPI0023DA6E17|nr:DUF1345 domain-containing protein [Rhizobium gei]
MMAMREKTIIYRRHLPFYAGMGAGLAALTAGLLVQPTLSVSLAAVAFFSVYLALIARRLPSLTATYLRDNAAGTDEPAIVILTVTVLAAAVSLLSLFLVIARHGTRADPGIILAFSSVALGWLTIHTMAAMHYAHHYWSFHKKDAAVKRGLEFPGSEHPSGYDFLYFAFVVGMTAQTSDVAVTTTEMRVINLAHGIVSFFFNTVLVAAVVNAAVALAQ